MQKLILFFILTQTIAFAQTEPNRIQYKLKVNLETSEILNQIGQELASQDSEIALECIQENCTLDITPTTAVQMDVDLIERPFVGGPMVLRIYGGSQKTLGAIYKALGELTSTNDFQGRVDERKLQLDKNNIKFRCEATRTEPVQYQCWNLFHANILDLSTQTSNE